MTSQEAQLLLAGRRRQARRVLRRDASAALAQLPQRSRRLAPPGRRAEAGTSPGLFIRAAAAAVALVLCAALCGCKPAAAPPPPIAPEAVPATLERAFANAPEEVSTTVQAVAEAARQQDPQAVFVLMDLSARPTLTPEQRAAVAASMQGLLDQARRSAEQGNVEAAKVVEKYRASK